MRYTLASFLLVGAMVVGRPASAHDEKLHRGQPTEGRVTSVESGAVLLETAHGKVRIGLSDETRYERAEHVVSKDALRAGERVAVFGTTLPGGTFVAREVVIENGGQNSEKHEAHDER